MSNLKVKTARGSMFMASLSLVMRPISMALAIVLLRLLNPADFGLLALAMILFNTANLITDLGLRPAIVQTKHDIRKVAHYAFVLVMLASMAMTGLVILLAPPIASFLGGGEELIPILRWMAVYITVDGLWIVPEALLRRELRFKQLGLSQIPGELASTLIAIPLALMGFGVWSLVIGNISGQLLRSALLWAYYRPWIWLKPQKWEREIVTSLFRYGLPTMGGGALRYIQTQIDTWLVGRNFGTTSVGYYGRAYDLTTRLSDMLTSSIFGNVLFPSYAKMQDDRPRLARAYLKSTNMVFLMIVPLSVGLAITASLLVPVLLGPKWLPMIPIWQIFALYGLTRPISTNASPIFLAVGEPKRNLTASLLLLAIMVPAILLVMRPYGVAAVALVVSGAHLVTMLFNVFQVNQILPGTARKTFTQSLPFFAAGGVMALGVYLLTEPILTVLGGKNIASLLAVVLVGALIYIAMTLLLQRALVLELYELFVKALGIDRRWPRLVPQRLRTSK